MKVIKSMTTLHNCLQIVESLKKVKTQAEISVTASDDGKACYSFKNWSSP